MKNKVYIKSYGCQMNVYDANRMADVLRSSGYTIGETAEGSDLIILNTPSMMPSTVKVFNRHL